MNLSNLPAKTHEEAIKLKKTVYAFVPQQYHKTIEFSFQIFDTEQTKKLGDWRMGFSTFTMDDTNNFLKVSESKPNPKKGKGNIKSHTHLTRNEEKEDIETIEKLQVRKRSSSETLYLKFGYAYIHWKLLLPGDTPRHKWDTEKIEIAKGRPIIQPIYVGESGVAGSFDFFERSTAKRTSKYLTDKLNWIDEIQGGYVIWIINGLPTEWRLTLETHLIEFYGRADLEKGPLVNRTNGGQHNRGRLQGHPHTKESRKKISDLAFEREKNIDEAAKKKRSEKVSAAQLGVKHSKETRKKISDARKKYWKSLIRCEHCNEKFTPTAFDRYHGDNCIERPGLSDICDKEGNLLTWLEVNKKKHDAINNSTDNEA